MPFGQTLDAMQSYLPKLRTFDDVELKEWIRKAENSEKEFEIKPGDSDAVKNKKESM